MSAPVASPPPSAGDGGPAELELGLEDVALDSPPEVPLPVVRGRASEVAGPAPVRDAAPLPWNVPCNPRAPWPLNVPGLEEAERILRGEMGAPQSLARVTRILADGFSQDERAALRDSPGFDATPVRRALCCHWRLVAAMTLASPPPAFLDKPALEAMYAETDAVFEGLRALEATVPQAAAVAKTVRMHLTSIAVDFSEFAQQLSAEMGRPEPPTVVRKHTESDRARLLAVETVSPRPFRMQQWALPAALALALLVAGAYQGARLLSRAPAAVPAWAPAGTIVIPGSASVPETVLVPDGRPLPAEGVAQLEAHARSVGKTVRESSPGYYLLIPAESADPSAGQGKEGLR